MFSGGLKWVYHNQRGVARSASVGGVHLIGGKSNYCISARDSYTLALPIEKER